MNTVELAMEDFLSGLNCCQAVLAAYAERCNLNRNTALKMACAFDGVIGRLGNTCGAVTAAYMIIGLHDCSADPSDEFHQRQTHNRVLAFTREFTLRNWSTSCPELLFSVNEQATSMSCKTEPDAFSADAACTKFVTDAVEILEEIL